MPDGNNIVLIWVFLLAQAGESNKGGALFFTDTIPYNLDGLAIQFDFPIDVIKLALNVLENFGMIEIFEDIIYIKNWSEYQNIDGLERIREQTRLRVSKYKQNKKLLTDGNVSGNVTVTQGNATEEELELDIDIDIDKKESIKKKPKHKYGEYQNVLLSDEELEKLKIKFTDFDKRLEKFSKGIKLKSYGYKDHYLAILKWAEKDEKDKPQEINRFADYVK